MTRLLVVLVCLALSGGVTLTSDTNERTVDRSWATEPGLTPDIQGESDMPDRSSSYDDGEPLIRGLEKIAERRAASPTRVPDSFVVPDFRPLRVGEVSGQPIALAAGDFDRDGMADLVCGYADPSGNSVTLHRGNIDAILPSSAAARERRAAGTLTDGPFLAPIAFDAADRPDFLGVGDFDNDGNTDVVLGSRGGWFLHLLKGDGTGSLSAGETVEIPGALTAMAVGEVNRPDGLVDLVTAVVGPHGASVLVFEGPQGALQREPEVLPMPMQVTALALARLHGHAALDLLVATDHQLKVVRGRDRWLSLGAEQQDEVEPAMVETIALGGAIRAVTTGDFDRKTDGHEIAVLFDDGTMSVLGRQAPRGEDSADWLVLQRLEVAVPSAGHGAMVSGRLSGSLVEDVVILDKASPRLVVSREGRLIGSADLGSPPTAVLPMRLNGDALIDLVLIEGGRTLSTAISAPLATITVTTAADTAVAGDEFCSFREAIDNANSDTDTTDGDCATGAGADAIVFNVGGGGTPVAIALASALPTIVGPVVIDGNTQECATPPCVRLDGSAAGAGVDGLVVAGGASTVRGLLIRDFDGDGISLESPANLIEGNFVGTDAAGTTAAGNSGVGIFVMDADNVIGGTAPDTGNLVSGNGDGIVIMGSAAISNLVRGNMIGTDVSGTAALGNGQWGILIYDAPENVVGGSLTGARNLVSGNGGAGIRIEQAQAIGNLVQGNYVGVNVVGDQAVTNTLAGTAILYDASDNLIGGTAVGAGNLISGNTTFGVGVVFGATGNRIEGNFIGTDHTGTRALPNLKSGVIVQESTGNTIGGAVAEAGNLISANEHDGVYLQDYPAPGNQVLGNLIGTDVNGNAALGNGIAGVRIENASGNVVGEVSPGRSNLISGNTTDGVFVEGASTSNLIQGNFIGTNAAGTAALPNEDDGIHVSAASGNTIGGDVPWAGNLLSGNADRGVVVSDGASSNKIQGNLIGTDISIDSPLANFDGVLISNAHDNTVGGAEGAGNLISGNTYNGVWLYNGSTGNRVSANLIGTKLNGTEALSNGANGVSISLGSSSNAVGAIAEWPGNLISANGWNGVILHGTGTSGNHVMGNLIGTDINGTGLLGNLRGVLFNEGASGNIVGGTTPEARNVISANTYDGVNFLEPATTDNQVLGNFIGTDISGTVALANDWNGVSLDTGASFNFVGGASPGAGNLISGNTGNGVRINAPGTTGNQVLGNFIGTDVSGTASLGNLLRGVFIIEGASSNLIGGSNPGARNVIAGNGTFGISILNGPSGNEIRGNHIGTDVSGMVALGQGSSGVVVQDSTNNIIGGTTAGAGNLISGNSNLGIYLYGSLSSGNQVLGNLVGTNATGAPVLGNGWGGVGIYEARSNAVGGTVEGAGNLIAGNENQGVVIWGSPANRNSVLGNSIFANSLLGIDLNWPDGVTLNDEGDADTGPNDMQNFPSLTLVEAVPASITIEGGLNSTATADFRIEFFTNTICDPTNYGEGERFLGYTEVTTNAAGDASFSVTLPVPVSDGDSIATTATDELGNTSEFCGCVTVSCLASVVFADTIVAQDRDAWGWGGPGDVRYAKGDLAGVDSYTTTDDGTLFGVSSLDMSMDLPATGDGVYYVVRPLGCGSWQTVPGAEPGRDGTLP